MGLFGGCGNNNDQWIWVLIIIVLVFACGDGNVFGGNNCCECRESRNDCC